MKKKRLGHLLAGVMVFLSLTVPAVGAQATGTSIMVNNNIVAGSVNNGYYNYNGTLLSPAKELAEALGGNFVYDEASKTGALRVGENELLFRLDNSIVKYNGKNMQAEAPMKIIGNRFMVPVKFTAQKLGAEAYVRADKNFLMLFKPLDGKLVYKVVQGDSLWIISNVFSTTIDSIKNLNALSSDTIYTGQNLIVKNINSAANKVNARTINSATLWKGPGFNYSEVNYLQAGTSISVIGKTGNWFKVETPKGTGYIYYTVMSVIQDIDDSAPDSKYFASSIPVDTSNDSVIYSSYTVQKGESLWSISEKYFISDYELAAANNISRDSILYIGQVLKIPVHKIGLKSTLGPKYGEVLDWFTQAQYVFPIGKIGKLTDMETGKSFNIKRTMGANHSDTETLTASDTQIMKEIFGGKWTWNTRPFILEVDGRRFAVSVAGMPHAGVDGVPYLQNVANRSDNWGYGQNLDSISGNGMDGHFDLYFLNCLRHKDNQLDPSHQYNVLKAGGLQ